MLPHNLLDPPLVLHPVPLVHVVSFGLGRRLRVGVVEQVLHAQEDMLDRDGGFPRLLLVQDGQADGARRVDVGVEERGNEFACMESRVLAIRMRLERVAGLTLRWFRGIFCARTSSQ